MQYLPPSHQTLDLNSSHSFVESSWSVFRNGLCLPLHALPWMTCNFFPIFFPKNSNVFYTRILKYDLMLPREECWGMKWWVYFFQPIMIRLLLSPINAEQQLYVLAWLPSGRLCSLQPLFAKLHVVKRASWHLQTSISSGMSLRSQGTLGAMIVYKRKEELCIMYIKCTVDPQKNADFQIHFKWWMSLH